MRAMGSMARLGALVWMSAAGCGEAGGDATGATLLEITNVPAGVQCLRFSVQSPGASAVTLDRGVTGGGEATVNLGALPGGNTVLSAQAFTVACASATPGSAPAWIAAPQTYEIRAGYRNEIDLTFRPNTEVIARGDFVVPVRSISIGSNAEGRSSLAALLQDGTVRVNGSLTGALRPVSINLSGVTQVALGPTHGCALVGEGDAYCWGNNSGGQLGTGTQSSSDTPVPVVGGLRFRQLGLGDLYSCGLSGDNVYCWGLGSRSGGPNPNVSTAPQLVYSQALEIDAGLFNTCVRLRNGRVACAGLNNAGMFGIGHNSPVSTYTSTPFPITSAFDSYLAHACSVDLLGGVKCAGANFDGQAGNGSSGGLHELTPVTTMISGVSRVAAGGFFTCALKVDSTVWCWGSGTFGQVGTAAAAGVAATTRPVQVLTDAIQVEAGYEFACALRRDRSVWCWGNNANGQIGDGTNAVRYTPVRVQF